MNLDKFIKQQVDAVLNTEIDYLDFVVSLDEMGNICHSSDTKVSFRINKVTKK